MVEGPGVKGWVQTGDSDTQDLCTPAPWRGVGWREAWAEQRGHGIQAGYPTAGWRRAPAHGAKPARRMVVAPALSTCPGLQSLGDSLRPLKSTRRPKTRSFCPEGWTSSPPGGSHYSSGSTMDNCSRALSLRPDLLLCEGLAAGFPPPPGPRGVTHR